MKLAVIGIVGRVGSRLASELLARGHTVTGMARNPEKFETRPGVVLKRGDATSAPALAPLITGHDAVLSASRFLTSNARSLISAVKQAGVNRLLVVGGAASLEVAPGMILMETPDFPEEYKAEPHASCAFLDTLRKEKDLDWTFLSPSYEFAPGERTGHFRLGGNELLRDGKGRSWISMEDFAIALDGEKKKFAASAMSLLSIEDACTAAVKKRDYKAGEVSKAPKPRHARGLAAKIHRAGRPGRQGP